MTPPGPIPMAEWGRDHWSTLGYLETRCVDHGGAVSGLHMRTDVALHPNMGPTEVVGFARQIDGAKYATRLRGGAAVAFPHDDWSCLDDAEASGLVENVGTGAQRRYKFTERGQAVAAALRKHKAGGGSFSNFDPGAVLAPQQGG